MQRTIIAIVIIFLVSVIIGAVFVLLFQGEGRQAARQDLEQEEKIGTSETILISNDRGETWKQAEIPELMSVSEIYPSMARSGRFYVLTVEGEILVKDRDEGWKKIILKSMVNGDKKPIYYYLAEDERGNIYISAYFENRGRIIKYNLKNKTEEEIFKTPLEKYAVFGIRAAPDGRILRIISSDGGIYESADFGYSWKILKRFKEGLLGITANPATGDFWILDSEGKILKFSSPTKTTSDFSNSLKKFSQANVIKNLIFDENSDTLYLASGYGVLKSASGEDNWQSLPLLVPPQSLPIEAVAVSSREASEIYAGSGNEFYKSEDNGASWRTIVLPTSRIVSRIAVDSTDSNIIYVGLKTP